jgi:cell volume regulation protein A
VYLTGIVMSNSDLLHRRSLQRIHDAAAWLCQIGMFLVLGLLVLPSQLGEVALPALIVAASLVLLARPLAVMATLLFSRFSIAERAMISWVGLRGAVPIILATFPLVAGVDSAPLIFDVVFFAVLISVLIQGTTIPVVARWLGVDEPAARLSAPPLEAVDVGQGGARLHTMVIQEGARAAGCSLVELHLPPGTLVVLVQRHDAYMVPVGATQLLQGDSVMVLAAPEELEQVREALAPAHR